MKKKILFAIFSVVAGIAFTFFFLNKEDTFAKEEYLIYVFQVGAFEKYDNAVNFSNSLPSSIIKKEGNLYKIYVAMYKDIDIVNKMIVYFENNDINIYLKNLNVSKNFYNDLLNYETLIKSS